MTLDNHMVSEQERADRKSDTCTCGGTLDDVDFCATGDGVADCEDCPALGVLQVCEGIVVKKVCRDCGANYETE